MGFVIVILQFLLDLREIITSVFLVALVVLGNPYSVGEMILIDKS